MFHAYIFAVCTMIYLILPAIWARAMADIFDAPKSTTINRFVIRTETFVNQFRAAFLDESGCSVEWIFQVNEPVWYNDDSVSGYTTIKDISTAGFFTVRLAPTVKNETAFAHKYIHKLSLEKIWELLSYQKAPPAEEFLWERLLTGKKVTPCFGPLASGTPCFGHPLLRALQWSFPSKQDGSRCRRVWRSCSVACAPHTSNDGSGSNYRERCIITELLEDTFYVDLVLNIMEWSQTRRVAALIHAAGQSRHLRIVRGRKKVFQNLR